MTRDHVNQNMRNTSKNGGNRSENTNEFSYCWIFFSNESTFGRAVKFYKRGYFFQKSMECFILKEYYC